MTLHHDDRRLLCACTAEIIRLTALDPATCRAFADDFAPLLHHLAARGADPRRAAQAGTIFAWAAILAGRDAALRAGRACRRPDAVGRAAAAALLRDAAGDPRLRRLARAALARPAPARAA